MLEEPPYPPIGAYAAIGDTRTLALVSREGSLDWLCLPDFHSEAVFAAILDRLNGGRLLIRPAAGARITRRYLDNVPVLETRFETDGGVMVLTDFMPLVEGAADRLEPERQILRIVDVVEGAVEVDLLVAPRPGFGGDPPRVRRSGPRGWTFSAGNRAFLLRTDLEVKEREVRRLWGRTRMSAGERRYLSFSYTGRDISIVVPLEGETEKKLDETRGWWRGWQGQIDYAGPYREDVLRSAMALRLLTCSQSGAVLAAGTSSLPEAIEGKRNWDYRFCWLRDAAYILNSFSGLGLTEDAGSFFQWLLHATQLTRPQLATCYDLYGRTNIREHQVKSLEGYRSTGPVRRGNGAASQLQLDVYGSVMTAIDHYRRRGGEIHADEKGIMRQFGETVCRMWRQPDEGVWEFRFPRKHTTYSKAMCWRALDILVQMAEDGVLDIPDKLFRQEREELRETILRDAWNEKRQAFTGAFGEDFLDASVLTMSRIGLIDAGDERMRRTWERIVEHLQPKEPLIYRYVPGLDGFPKKEGTFGVCCFWAVEYLALRGDLAEARRRFEALLEYGNDLGLYSEEIDPETGELLGNMPQALTHAGLIIAAMAIGEAEERNRREAA